jgi:hypothetical protein
MMPARRRERERILVELFLSAYEDAWANCHRDYLEERIDSAVEVLARATNGATLAIEHTLIEPFVGDREDFVRFRDSFLRIEDDTSLIVPERAVYGDVPVQSLKKHERAPAVRALHEWLTANVRSLPVGQSRHDCPIRLDENNYGVLSLEIRVESNTKHPVADN